MAKISIKKFKLIVINNEFNKFRKIKINQKSFKK